MKLVMDLRWEMTERGKCEAHSSLVSDRSNLEVPLIEMRDIERAN